MIYPIIVIKYKIINMQMCDANCNLLEKCVRKLYDLTRFSPKIPHDTIELLDSYENGLLQYFEDNFVAFIQNHRDECVRRSLNILIDVEGRGWYKYQKTLINAAIDVSMFNLVVRLFEYGADPTIYYYNPQMKSCGLKIYYYNPPMKSCGLRIIEQVFEKGGYAKKCRQFLEKEPKTHAENAFLKKIIENISCYDLDLLLPLAALYPYMDIIPNTLIKYGTNVDYCYGMADMANVSSLIYMIHISRRGIREESIMCKYFDSLAYRYNFLKEGPNINITDNLNGSLNVLEYAQLYRNDTKTKIICGKIIDYFQNCSETGKEINALLPMPIVEVIIPDIVPPKDIVKVVN